MGVGNEGAMDHRWATYEDVQDLLTRLDRVETSQQDMHTNVAVTQEIVKRIEETVKEGMRRLEERTTALEKVQWKWFGIGAALLFAANKAIDMYMNFVRGH